VLPSHLMHLVRAHSQILQRNSAPLADPDRPPQRDPKRRPTGERPERRIRLGKAAEQVTMSPDVCAPSSGIVTCAKNKSDRVILEPGRENVCRTVAQGIGD